MRYTQCEFTMRITTTKTRHIVTWIPYELAKMGKIVQVNKEDGWTVFKTYGTIDEAKMIRNRDLHRRADELDMPRRKKQKKTK